MSGINTEMKCFEAISDVISILNMTSGFLSVISSINHNFELSAILMIIAIMFDSVDGWVARKTIDRMIWDSEKTLIPFQTQFHSELHRRYLFTLALTPPQAFLK